MSRPSNWCLYQDGRGKDPTIVVGKRVLVILTGISRRSLSWRVNVYKCRLVVKRECYLALIVDVKTNGSTAGADGRSKTTVRRPSMHGGCGSSALRPPHNKHER